MGSGKTVVAILSLVKAVENGYQAVIMAPTEILATQHFEGITEFCNNLPINIALLQDPHLKKKRIESMRN